MIIGNIIDTLCGKNIVIGVGGGISAYKSASLVSALVNLGVNVRVIMTKNATKFISPLAFKTLTHNAVYVDMFEDENYDGMEVKHISITEKADVFLIAPATANIIGKVANGIADDMLLTTIMATTCPVVFAPAMNCNMYKNKMVQNNIEKLKQFGYKFIEPATGHLACGTDDIGKLPDTRILVSELRKVFE